MKFRKAISIFMFIALISGMFIGGMATTYASTTTNDSFDSLDTGKWDVTVGAGTTAEIENGRLKVTGAAYGSVVTLKQKFVNYTVSFDMERTSDGWAGIVLNKPGITDTYAAGGMLMYFQDGTIDTLFNGAAVASVNGVCNGGGRVWVAPPKGNKVSYKIEVIDGVAKVYFAYPGSSDLTTLQAEFDKVALSEGYIGFVGDGPSTFYLDNLKVEDLGGGASTPTPTPTQTPTPTVDPANVLDSNVWDTVLTSGGSAIMEDGKIKITGANFPSIISLKQSYGTSFELKFDMKKVDAKGWAGVVIGKPGVSDTFSVGGFLMYFQPGVVDALLNSAPAYPSTGTDVDPNAPIRVWTRSDQTNQNITYKLIVVKDKTVSLYYFNNDVPFDQASNNIDVLRAKFENVEIKDGYIGFGVEGAPTVYLSNVSVGPVQETTPTPTVDPGTGNTDTDSDNNGTDGTDNSSSNTNGNPKTSDTGFGMYAISAVLGLAGAGFTGIKIRKNRKV